MHTEAILDVNQMQMRCEKQLACIKVKVQGALIQSKTFVYIPVR
jgi:hypothetical protein